MPPRRSEDDAKSRLVDERVAIDSGVEAARKRAAEVRGVEVTGPMVPPKPAVTVDPKRHRTVLRQVPVQTPVPMAREPAREVARIGGGGVVVAAAARAAAVGHGATDKRAQDRMRSKVPVAGPERVRARWKSH